MDPASPVSRAADTAARHLAHHERNGNVIAGILAKATIDVWGAVGARRLADAYRPEVP